MRSVTAAGKAAALGSLGTATPTWASPAAPSSYYEQWLVIAREIGDRRGEGHALSNLGPAYAEPGSAAQSSCTISSWIIREIGDRGGEGNALGNLGIAFTSWASTPAIGYKQG